MTSKEIKPIVDRYFGIDIANRKRTSEYSFARFVYAKLCKANTYDSYQKIGKPINRDHATITYALKEIENIFSYYPIYKMHYSRLNRIISSRKLRTVEDKREDAFKLAMHYRKKYLECLK